MNEQEILKFWEDNKIFEKTIEKEAKDFVFYDGPPFATGLPHYGHILANIIKDAIPRYQTMKGKRVPRKWGWDCHGLPVENLIEKDLNLQSKKDIEEYGIEKFNKAARDSVLKYADEWKKIIPRIGRWVDMERDYKTMDLEYTESVWWVFKSLYDKGLVYEGYKSMHICPRCETTLSNFEVTQNYQDIKDISITVKFELNDEPNTYILAWTTTPWTLPGNVALAINPDIEYVKIKIENNFYILSKDRLEIIKDEYEIIEKIKGKDLIGKKYKPLFNYFANSDIENKENGWKIYGADFVSTDEGTGVVHIAPAFGEDDMNLGNEKKLPFVQHVTMNGKFNPEAKDFAGQNVKPKENPQEADVNIIKFLAKNNLIFAKESITHSYPFCWRCDTPLLNYATSSWFVEVTKIKDKLLKNNKKINWIPSYLQDGRFGKWLEGARDWAISRSRFWGAPLPVWKCEECNKIETIGSVKELGEKSIKTKNKYFFLRHGEADHNLNRMDGSEWPEKNPSNLTEKGKRDIEKISKRLKEEKIDFIYSSDYTRTKQTAEIISKETGVKANFDKRLREYNIGMFKSRTYDEFNDFIGDEMNKFIKTPDEGENLNDIIARMMDFVLEFEKNNKEKKVLIISHGDPLWALEGAMQGLGNKSIIDIKKDYIEVGQLKEIELLNLPYAKNGRVDLHRPYIDDVELKCSCGEKIKRVPEVFDCWFESGSMPYGQSHYPFENKKEFEKDGAEFIAEGLDQTRGWFYTLLVLSTALFDKPAYKNVVVNGIILAEDGQKMSKRLNNYPDPMNLIDKYGADALRYYLLSSPAVRAESLNFSEKGVDEVNKKVISKLRNVLNFYKMYALGSSASKLKSENILDKWINIRFNELVDKVTNSMDKYELDKAVRPIGDFVDDLSNWHVRRSRDRFKKEGKDKEDAIAILRNILFNLSKLIAPFIPFIAEEIYQELKDKKDKESVHLDNWIKSEKLSKKDEKIIEEMREVRKIVAFGLEERSKVNIKVRQPLSVMNITSKINDNYLFLIADEVNVKEVKIGQKENSLNLEITEELIQEGMLRELLRKIQDLRKNVGLVPQDKVELVVDTDEKGKEFVSKFKNEIRKSTNLTTVNFSSADDEEIKIEDLIFKLKIKK